MDNIKKEYTLNLDKEFVSSLRIGTSLKGQEATQIVISGPGFGSTPTAAEEDAAKEMNRLQTVLISGSLPVDIEVVRIDFISPVLGHNFVQNSILTIPLFLPLSYFVKVRLNNDLYCLKYILQVTSLYISLIHYYKNIRNQIIATTLAS